MKMYWFKMLSSDRNDRRLRLLSRDQFWVYFNLLCYASEQDKRGMVNIDDMWLLAIEVSDGDEALLTSTIAMLLKVKILTQQEDGSVYFTEWDSRHYEKQSDTPEATRVRKQAQRARERDDQNESSDVSRDVTPSHAMSRDVTHREEEEEERKTEEKREEENRKEKTTKTAHVDEGKEVSADSVGVVGSSELTRLREITGFSDDFLLDLIGTYSEPLKARNLTLTLEVFAAKERHSLKYPRQTMTQNYLLEWLRRDLSNAPPRKPDTQQDPPQRKPRRDPAHTLVTFPRGKPASASPPVPSPVTGDPHAMVRGA
jgi:hypothetical protein